MANSKTIKKTSAVAEKLPAKIIAPAAVAAAPAPAASKTLTIVVVDAKSQPVQGANISIQPGGTVGSTDSSGVFDFKLGNYPKYDVTASYGSNSVTVPYYVTRDGATRLVVNPSYVNAVQQQRSASSFGSVFPIVGITIAVAVAVVAIWKIFSHPR